MRNSLRILFAGLLCAALTYPGSALGQDLKYTTTTNMKLEGTAGSVVNFLSRLTGGSDEKGETVYVKGNNMRTDSDGSSTILDLDGSRFLILNHDNKVWAEMKFAEMAEMAEDAVSQIEETIEEARTEAQAEANRQSEEMDIDVEYDLNVNRTGETRTIRGHHAERVLMIMTARGSTVVEQDGETEDLEGSMILANEMWITTDESGELQPLFDFQKRMGQSMSDSFAEMAGVGQTASADLSAAFATDARMSTMMKDAAEAMEEIDGYALITTMKFVVVPGNVAFNPALAFGDEQEEKEEVTTTQRAGRMARGLLRNRLGRSSNNEPADEPREVELRQTTLVTMVTEISDVERTSLPSSLFEIPADYQERTIATLYR